MNGSNSTFRMSHTPQISGAESPATNHRDAAKEVASGHSAMMHAVSSDDDVRQLTTSDSGETARSRTRNSATSDDSDWLHSDGAG